MKQDFNYYAPELAQRSSECCKQYIRLDGSKFHCARKVREGAHTGMHDANCLAKDGERVRW